MWKKSDRSERVALMAKTTDRGTGFPARYALAILSFLGFANVYALRVNLSIAIVAMVQQPDDPPDTGKFQWSKTMQGIVLGSFFYGYIFTQIPGGWLASRYGGKLVFGGGVLCTTVLTLVTPVAARANVWLLVVVRILEGVGEGVTFPAMHAIWAKWAPPLERSRLSTISYAGPHFGTVISMPLSGWLSRHGFGAYSGQHYSGAEWPSVFYIFGAVGLVWCFLWFWLAADSPEKHPRIHPDERYYIESCIQSEQQSAAPVSVPWTAIFTSAPQWAIVVAHFCTNWGFYTLLTCLPTFMKDALGFKLVNNGLYSALPYLVYGTLIPIIGRLADYLRENYFSTTAVRKAFNFLGMALPALFLVLVGYAKSSTLAVVYLVLAVGSVSPANSGFNINHLDIAPRFAGVLMGISNMIATIPGIVCPLVANAMTAIPDDKSDDVKMELARTLWRNVFFLSAEVYIFGAIVYTVFGSGSPQWWADGAVYSPSSQDAASIQVKKREVLEGRRQWGRSQSVTPLLYPTDEEG